MAKPSFETNVFVNIAHFVIELHDTMNLAIDIGNLATELTVFIPRFHHAI